MQCAVLVGFRRLTTDPVPALGNEEVCDGHLKSNALVRDVVRSSSLGWRRARPLTPQNTPGKAALGARQQVLTDSKISFG